MKKIALVGATLAFVLAAGSVSAANSMSTGTIGLNVPVVSTTDPLISGKYFMNKDMAILGGFGFSSGGTSGNSVTTFALEAGVRKYMNTNDFAPFIGGVFDYTSTSSTPSQTTMGLIAEAGAEYFLAKQFSIEGKVGFGYTSNDTGNAATKTTNFGSSRAHLSVNFYF